MALIPSITVSLHSDGESFKFTETTGLYDVTSNPGGYGAPNATTGASTGSLVVKDLTNDVTYDAITITPSSSNGITYITEAMLEVAGVAISDIADGIWSFTYTVTSASVDYTTEYRTLVIKEINCRMTALSLKYADKSCGCCNNRSFRELFVEAHALYASLCASVTCGNVALINEQITFLETFLSDLNCKNC